MTKSNVSQLYRVLWDSIKHFEPCYFRTDGLT